MHSSKKVPNPWTNLLRHERHELVFGDTILMVEEGVFTPNPAITYSTAMILDNMPPLDGKRVADVGTGTGIIALKAIACGAREVVATDISAVAVKNARANAALNKVGGTLNVVETSLLEGVEGKFDVIFANLPILDEVWTAENIAVAPLLKKLFDTAKLKLSIEGKMFLPWGSFAEQARPRAEELLAESGLQWKLLSKNTLGYVWYLYIVCL